LYVGADVNDMFVTNTVADDIDKRDGIRLTINTRDSLEVIDHVLLVRLLDVRVGATGLPILGGYLKYLDSVGLARVSLKLKPGTTVNDANDIDAGYKVEMKVSLRAFGYPAGRGDGVLFLGALLFDHDAFSNPTDDYGTRTWFMREHDRGSAPAWCYLDPSALVNVGEEMPSVIPNTFAVIGNYPNPFNPSTTITYMLPTSAAVTFKVFDVLGRSVQEETLGQQSTGEHRVIFNAGGLSSGVYLCQFQAADPVSGTTQRTSSHRIVLIK
jgi:hypothetical protein